MNKHKRCVSPIHRFLPIEVEGFDSLAELALDMRWSWNHAADEVWLQLDPELWDLTHNPWVILQTVSRDRLQQALADPGFRRKVDDLLETKCHEGGGARLVSAESSRECLDLGCLFQHGVHVE